MLAYFFLIASIHHRMLYAMRMWHSDNGNKATMNTGIMYDINRLEKALYTPLQNFTLFDIHIQCKNEIIILLAYSLASKHLKLTFLKKKLKCLW